MPTYFRLVTRWTPEKITEIEKQMESGMLHPRDAKMQLAFEVTSVFYSDKEAKQAEDDFVNTFQKNKTPDEIDEFVLGDSRNCLDVLQNSNLVESRSQARNLIKQNAIKLDGKLIQEWDDELSPGVLQVGKRKFVRLVEK